MVRIDCWDDGENESSPSGFNIVIEPKFRRETESGFYHPETLDPNTRRDWNDTVSRWGTSSVGKSKAFAGLALASLLYVSGGMTYMLSEIHKRDLAISGFAEQRREIYEAGKGLNSMKDLLDSFREEIDIRRECNQRLRKSLYSWAAFAIKYEE